MIFVWDDKHCSRTTTVVLVHLPKATFRLLKFSKTIITIWSHMQTIFFSSRHRTLVLEAGTDEANELSIPPTPVKPVDEEEPKPQDNDETPESTKHADETKETDMESVRKARHFMFAAHSSKNCFVSLTKQSSDKWTASSSEMTQTQGENCIRGRRKSSRSAGKPELCCLQT